MKKLILFAWLVCLATFSYSVPATLSITGFSPGTFVRGQFYTLSVAYSTTGGGTFNASNTFTAQLSNSTGTFGATTLASVTGTAGSGTLNFTIPISAGTATGAGYRIRIVSSSPALTSGDNGTNITISSSTLTCATIPPEPACPTSGTTIIPTNGGLSSPATYRLDPANSFVRNGFTTQTIVAPNSLNNGGTGTIIYVCSGEHLVVQKDYSPNNNDVIIVLTGGKLTIGGNLNGGITYIYGTLRDTTAAGQIDIQNNVKVNIAKNGSWDASVTKLSINGGSFTVEGTANFGTLEKVQNSPSQGCIRKDGCVQFNTITNGALLLANSFTNDTTDSKFGFIYYPQTTCPTSGNTFTTSSRIKICTKETPGPCAFWGSATVKYNCVPGAGTGLNCTGAIALPVSLSFFKSRLTQEGVLLTWGIKRTWDSKAFLIEKSNNGIQWELVSSTPSLDGTSYREYSIYDPDPFNGSNYYRLSEVDVNGQVTPYSVEFVETDNSSDYFTIYPNPAGKSFSVSVSGDHPNYNLEIINLTGSSVGKYILHQGTNRIDSDLPKGLYIAKLKVEKNYKIQRLIID